MQPSEPLPAPAAYKPEYAEEARKWALMRASDEALAAHFEVPLATFRDWLGKVPAFAAAVRCGRKMGDADVVDGFHRNCRGFTHEAEKIFRPVGAEPPVRVTYVKQYPPNTPAGKFWLVNRLPGEWRMKIEIEAELSDENIPDLTRAQLHRYILELAALRGLSPQDPPG